MQTSDGTDQASESILPQILRDSHLHVDPRDLEMDCSFDVRTTVRRRLESFG